MIALLAVTALGQTCITQQVAYQPVQYQQQAYNQAYVEKTIFVAVEDPQAYYAGMVGTQQRLAERQQQAQQAAATTDAKIDQLTRIVEALQKRLEAQPNEQPQAQQSLLPPRPVASPSTPASEAVPPPPTVIQAAANGVRQGTHPGIAILAANCAGCHGKDGTSKGGRQFFDRSGTTLQADASDLQAMRDAILSQRMPPQSAKRSPLTLREFATINDLMNERMNNVALNTLPRKTR